QHFPEFASRVSVAGDYDPEARTGSNFLDSQPVSPLAAPTTRAENRERIQEEIAGQFCEVVSRPMRAHIEINSACNLKCQMCDVGVAESQGRPSRAFIPDDDLQKMKVFYPHLEYVEIQGGEVFFYSLEKAPLTKVLLDLRDHAPKDVEILITTNALALNQRWADFLIDSDIVSHLSVSIDTMNPEAYERQRLGGKLSVVLRNLEDITN